MLASGSEAEGLGNSADVPIARPQPLADETMASGSRTGGSGAGGVQNAECRMLSVECLHYSF